MGRPDLMLWVSLCYDSFFWIFFGYGLGNVPTRVSLVLLEAFMHISLDIGIVVGYKYWILVGWLLDIDVS